MVREGGIWRVALADASWPRAESVRDTLVSNYLGADHNLDYRLTRAGNALLHKPGTRPVLDIRIVIKDQV